jgi:putative component of membrane protein insertase Oxa1/YidC/SpoIIIJ protein YidD
VAELAIGAYRRCVSPRKGFSCACRVHKGRRSCSIVGQRAIRRYGVLAGMRVLRGRLAYCGEVHRRMARAQVRPRRAAGQRGDCDLGCIDHPCDMRASSGGGVRLCSINCCSDCGTCEPGGFRRRDRELHARWGPLALGVLVGMIAMVLLSGFAACRGGGCRVEPVIEFVVWAGLGSAALVHLYVLVLRVRRGMQLAWTLLSTLALAVVSLATWHALAALARNFGGG